MHSNYNILIKKIHRYTDTLINIGYLNITQTITWIINMCFVLLDGS